MVERAVPSAFDYVVIKEACQGPTVAKAMAGRQPAPPLYCYR